MGTKPKRPQPLLIRLTHWINVPALVIMAMSGLQILRAYPYFGPQGARYDWVPLQAWESPEWMRAGGWLAGARHLHFAFAWLLVINAIIYLVYLVYSGEWRRRFFWPPRDGKPALAQFLYYIRVRKDEPPKNLYNSLQRSAYTAAVVLGVLEVLSGFAIWKPVQLHWLAVLMGGYDGARVIHFLALLGLIGFVVMHVVMVIVHYKQFPEMITGGKLESVDAWAEPPAVGKPAVAKTQQPQPEPEPVPATEPYLQALKRDVIKKTEQPKDDNKPSKTPTQPLSPEAIAAVSTAAAVLKEADKPRPKTDKPDKPDTKEGES